MPPSSPPSQGELYDAQPFLGRPCTESHPSHLAVIAKLSGLGAIDIERCRVLEIGCGDGTNLIAIAESLPNSTCIGIDLSERHIESGQKEAAALGVKNITLKKGDLLSLTPGDPSLGEFDFIIAHGFYSWVPRPVQDRMFAISRKHLSKKGVLFVSYNLLPGWRIMQVMRDFLSFHSRAAQSNSERVIQSLAATELLPLLTEGAHSDMARFVGEYARDLTRHLQRLGVWQDQAILHDIVGDINTPVYFSTFVNHAGRAGLGYLGDGEFRSNSQVTLSEKTIERLVPHVESPLDLEQYFDFARMRMFRQSLLCHVELKVKPEAEGKDLFGLYILSQLDPPKDLDLASDAQAEFIGEDDAVLRTNHPLSKAALLILSEHAPEAVRFEDLFSAAWMRLGNTEGAPSEEDVETLALYLLRVFATDVRLVGISAFAPKLAKLPGTHPRARGFARRQLARGDEVTTPYHRSIGLDPVCRKLVPLLDGTRDSEALARELIALSDKGQLDLAAFGDAKKDGAAFLEALKKEVKEQTTALAKLGVLVDN